MAAPVMNRSLDWILLLLEVLRTVFYLWSLHSWDLAQMFVFVVSKFLLKGGFSRFSRFWSCSSSESLYLENLGLLLLEETLVLEKVSCVDSFHNHAFGTIIGNVFSLL